MEEEEKLNRAVIAAEISKREAAIQAALAQAAKIVKPAMAPISSFFMKP